MYQSKTSTFRGKLPILIGALVILVILVGGFVMYKTQSSDGLKTRTAGQYTKGETVDGKAQASTVRGSTKSDDVEQPGDQKSNDGGATSINLLIPTGDFVSNHHPTSSGSPGPGMASVCTSTPGATCEIIFTKGSTTKSLSAQTTDRGGSTYWNWNINTLGLSEGTWQITAKATLGDQTKTADDALGLVVAQ